MQRLRNYLSALYKTICRSGQTPSNQNSNVISYLLNGLQARLCHQQTLPDYRANSNRSTSRLQEKSPLPTGWQGGAMFINRAPRHRFCFVTQRFQCSRSFIVREPL